MVYMFLGTGFEETEAIAPLDLLRRAAIDVLTVGLNGKIVYGSHNIGIEADITIDEMDLTTAEMIILPGGLGGVASIQACPAAMEAVSFAHQNGKLIAAICAGPTILASLGITNGKKAVCYPGCEEQMKTATITQDAALRDGNVITGTSMGCATVFGLMLIESLKDQETAQRIKNQIVIR